MASALDQLLQPQGSALDTLLAPPPMSALDQLLAVPGEFYRRSRIGAPGPLETLSGGRIPRIISRPIDVALNVANAPFALAGEAVKGAHEQVVRPLANVISRAVGLSPTPENDIIGRYIGPVTEAATSVAVPVLGELRAARALPALEAGRALPSAGLARGVAPRALARIAEAPKPEAAALEAARVPPLVPRIGPTPPGITAAPGGLVQPVLKASVNRRVVEASYDLFAKAGVQRTPGLKISDQLTDLIGAGKLPIQEFDQTLGRYNLTFTDFANGVFRPAIQDAGRRLQVLGALQKRINALAKQSGAEGELARLQDFAGQIDETLAVRPWWQRVDQIRRGLMVTQAATAARNFVSQVGRVGLDTLQQGVDRALQTYFRLPQTASPLEGLEATLNVFQKGNRVQVDTILKAFPREYDRFFGFYASDIANRTKQAGLALSKTDQVFDKAQNAVGVLNTLNRAQEFLVRRAVFQANVSRQLAQRGQNLEEMIAAGRQATIDPNIIRNAVQKSLEVTFAESPKYGSVGQKFISLVNSTAPISTGLLPFPYPRFMVNSFKFFFDFSPLGFTKLLTKKELAQIAAGNTQTISRALIGTGMLGAAYQVRQQYGGEKWYEVKIGDRTWDTRAYNPFASYLFVADLAKRHNEGTLNRLTAADVLQGVASVNFRAGTGLYLADQILGSVANPEDRARLLRAPQELLGTYLGSFLTPLQQVSDVLAQFDKNKQILREQRTEPLLGPIKARIPGVAETLPPAAFPTREGPMTREAPLFRQLTGVTLTAPKNPLEAELDRLGLTRAVVQPSTGDVQADRLVSEKMGPLAERILVPLVKSPYYQQQPDALKEGILRKALGQVRQAAQQLAAREDPQRFLKLRMRGLPGWERRLLEQRGMTPPP